jgi:cytochrome c-type biogenesis protein CcmH/NrfG
MIWLIMGIFVLGVLLYTAKPLFVKNAPIMMADSETAEYLEQITGIETQLKNADESIDVSALELTKVELQRQVLAKSAANGDAGLPKVFLSVLFIAFTLGTLGLYEILGRPELAKTQELAQNTAPQDVNELTLEQAVALLEQKLAQGDQSPQGWMLYARSLMSLRRYDDAIKAYEKVLTLTDNSPHLLEEFESAKTYIAQKSTEVRATVSGPDAEQMQAAAAMTPQARQEMIKDMVEGLSIKLKDNPKNLDGWSRLLRARKVLGQETEALADIKYLREAFKDNPQLAEKVLFDTGWAEE